MKSHDLTMLLMLVQLLAGVAVTAGTFCLQLHYHCIL